VYGLLCCLAALLLFSASGHAATKEETLLKYEQVIAKTNELTLYGYNVKRTGFKLKQMTDFLLANDFDSAGRLLDEISSDYEAVEAKGPESLRRESQLAWLQIFGDLIQQLALFLVMAFVLLRLTSLRRFLGRKKMPWRVTWRTALFFSAVSLMSGLLNFLRFSESSWAFLDLQVLFSAIAGMLGGAVPAAVVGLTGIVFRLLLEPAWTPYHGLPAFAAAIGWILFRGVPARPYPIQWAFAAGLAVGLTHGLFVYLPMLGHLPVYAFAFAVFFLTAAEALVFTAFFLLLQLIYREDKGKETERELLRTQLQFLRAQINPHFLFNAFNSVAAICGEEGAIRARRLIIQIAQMFRLITKSESDYVPLQEELDYIDTYLEIEKVRFSDRLVVEKDVRLSGEELKMLIPVLVLQPVVENAIKHGLSKKEEGGKLTIRASGAGERILIEIADTGVGMRPERAKLLFSGESGAGAASNDAEHTGIGLRNIRARLLKLFGERFDIQVESRPQEGTCVRIYFPRKG